MTTLGSKVPPRDAPRPWRASRVRRIEASAIAALGYPVFAALGRTWRWRREGIEHLETARASGHPPILALWHGRILPAVLFFRDRGVVAITSENFDGEWIARIMRRFGYAAARGSTSRGGSRALLQLKRDMASGKPAAFTVDGPRGPARRAQPGALWLAKATGHPVVAFHIEAARAWTTGGWDRAQIPRPWSAVAIAIAPPLWVPADAGADQIETARLDLEHRLAELERRARAMLSPV
ncbi:MAG TPA: lysophospholipid acyltransferase family protein [Vicinamibacterales bacterium]|nr:lysophospholipid acyltransferase family protein [Vicinamibacterales bacterium]